MRHETAGEVCCATLKKLICRCLFRTDAVADTPAPAVYSSVTYGDGVLSAADDLGQHYTFKSFNNAWRVLIEGHAMPKLPIFASSPA